ncbi:hypothetical protein ANO11243_092650 [Dothideomycetidae sp. 11243]|nr:hypothetical protein ANO11243_092650 [fungal sp. No.11243]
MAFSAPERTAALAALAEQARQDRESTADFFERLCPEYGHKSTEEACIRLANHILQVSDVQPTDRQGSSSFTLVSPSADQIVQFRCHPLNDETLQFAQTVYGSMTPKITRHVPEEGFTLSVYIVERARGIPLWDNPDMDDFPLQAYLRTTRDLAKLIARGARFAQSSSSPLPTGGRNQHQTSCID